MDQVNLVEKAYLTHKVGKSQPLVTKDGREGEEENNVEKTCPGYCKKISKNWLKILLRAQFSG